MADLFGLLQDLGERIASKGDSSGSTQTDEEDPVETRFRSVLPNLLQGYFVPSKVKEREVTAILKLLCHTVKNYPGVFFHGKAHALLPIIGRIIPFFAEPTISGRHGVLFETLAALLSLLKSGDRETYRLVFVGAMLLLEDLVSVASFFAMPTSFTQSTTVSIQCFSGAYSVLEDMKEASKPALFCELPSCWKPADSPGLLIDVTGQARWQPLAEWIMKLLGRCLAESALHLECLLTSPFASAVGKLLCYGDSALQKACFDLLHMMIPIMDAEALPSENIILSIVSILSMDGEESLSFRNCAYDSSMGACLSAILASGHRETIECTAQAILDVLPQVLLTTKSQELKMAMCFGFEQIVKHCSPCIWNIDFLLDLLLVPETGIYVYNCLKHAFHALGLMIEGEQSLNWTGKSPIDSNLKPQKEEENICIAGEKVSEELCPVERKRKSSMCGEINTKRHKLEVDVSLGTELPLSGGLQNDAQDGDRKNMDVALKETFSGDFFCVASNFGSFFSVEQQKSFFTSYLEKRLLRIIGLLEPEAAESGRLQVEGMLSAFQVLAKLFAYYPKTSCFLYMSEQMQLWIPWVSDKGQKRELTMLQLSTFLEGIDSFLLNAGTEVEFPNSNSTGGLLEVLHLSWCQLPGSDTELLQKSKSKAVSIASKLCSKSEKLDLNEVLTLALRDEDACIRSKVASMLPIMAAYSSPEKKREFCKSLGNLALDKIDEVREAVAKNVGLIACFSSDVFWAQGSSDLNPSQQIPNLNIKLKLSGTAGFDLFCSHCDTKGSVVPSETKPAPCSKDVANETRNSYLSPTIWQPLFSQLLFEEPSLQVQIAYILSMSRILQHASEKDLFSTREDWLKCLDILPLHRHRAVREAFCMQIQYFICTHVLRGLFGGVDDSGDAARELEMLGKFRHALDVTEDSDILETLLKMIAEIVLVSGKRRQLFFFSFVLLLEQLDSKYTSVQATSIRLLHKCAGLQYACDEHEKMQLMIESIRDELFEYLCIRLVTRPIMVKEFADAVMGIQSVDLVRQMVPVVLPKLVIQQQNNNEALAILNELAKQLGTELPLLLLEWCHKILSVLLLKADGKELMAALQFYESQTGSDTHEIFAAVLPALLEELIWFLGDTESEDAVRRSARVAPMIQEVARIVTKSDDLPGFLRTHFVGLLNSIDRKMLQAEHLASQKQALRCIERLIEMIGAHLSAFVPKIMVLLTRALQEQPLQLEGLRVWLSFVRRLAEVSPSNVKGIASQIVVALMPCLEGQQEENFNLGAVVDILEELVIRNRNILDDQAGELPLLPSLPALAKVNAVLHDARGLTSLHDQLKRAADGLSHESVSVRFMTSSELKKLIKTRRKDIMAMVLEEGNSDAMLLSHLVTSLLRGCSEESRTSISQRFKLICAECLGELGAIDPVKLHVNLRCRSKIERTDDDLIFELIHEQLARVLRAASDTDVQDAAALAIQELLKLGGCQVALLGRLQATASGIDKWNGPGHNVEEVGKTPQVADNSCDTAALSDRGEKLWSRFSDDVKEIITPCLTSKYLLKHANAAIPSGPIFRSGMSFRRWMYLWVRRLVSQSVGPRALIFNACRGVVRHDMGTALYLLPYLVLNVVCHGSTEARVSVTDEILSVLAEAASAITEVPTVSFGGESSANSSGTWSGPSEVSIQAVFTLLDNLGQWLDEFKQDIAFCQTIQAVVPSKGTRTSASQEVNQDVSQLTIQCNHVSQLLAAIPMTALAGASFRCQAYARALLYFESHVRTKSGSLNPAAEINGTFENEDVAFLLEIYSGLDEPDGLSGLSRLRKSISLQDQILINEKAGNWAEALTCYEQALRVEPGSIPRHSGVLDCLLNMGHLQAMVTHVDGLISRFPECKKEWCMRGVQAAWRLGKWDLLDEYLCGAAVDGSMSGAVDSNVAFDMSLAKVLQALQKKDYYMFAEQMMQSRQALLAPLAAASMESYTRAYPFIVKLHMLRELEDFQALFVEDCEHGTLNEVFLDNSDDKVWKMVEDWEDRLRITQPSLWTREPILALRRLVFSASNMQLEVGSCWLQYAKLCRAAGHYETANRAILEAQSSGAPNACMELAKLLWDTQKSHRAIAELQQALTKVPIQVLGNATRAALGGVLHIPSQSAPNQEPIVPTQSRRDEYVDAAKTLLLLARWVHHTGQKQKEDVLSIYSRVRELQPKCEKGFFFWAKYCDDLLVDARKRQEEAQEGIFEKGGASGKRRHVGALGNAGIVDDKAWWTYLPDVILYYAKGLHKGHRHMFQALPRLLTLWFEFGSIYHGEALSLNTNIKSVHGRVMSIMRGCLKDLPTYQWLTAFSQLVSRICHQNEEVVRLVKHIITAVLQAYPQQALWTMAAVSKSTVAARRQAAAEILQQARNSLRQEHENNLFSQFASLIEQLIKLCFHGGQTKSRTINLSAEFGVLKRMMPVGVIVPVQRALTVSLPSDGITNLKYNPFSGGDYPTISGIGEEVEILASLQRPKKVVLHGSDGTEHPFLCKPKDDLRKDARMMEFTTMINRLLSKDQKSRRRKLYIRTFAVIPLTEDCGMVEWVLHTRGLRHILQDLYVSCGKFDRQKTNPTIKRIYDQNQGQLSEAEMFRTKILSMFPPVFHKWFLNAFSEPATWFQARVAYAHTTAVWSMVGHIVGLGDRHGENILFDSTTGDCIHVDFSCLFDKGLQLEKPELVPFRLTQNMIDGLGITGYEGIFSRVCEITLSVLRSNRETLMTVLETFIHDPLVEWTKSHKSSGVEVQNPHAQRAISNIEARLQGVVVGVGAAPSLPLSVEGQAHRLIAEAVSHENLGRMYIWWMPWF